MEQRVPAYDGPISHPLLSELRFGWFFGVFKKEKKFKKGVYN